MISTFFSMKYRLIPHIDLPGSSYKPVAHQLLSSTSSKSELQELKFLTY
jgi:hypothetical protein